MNTPDSIVKSIDIKAPPARVWRALTDHREFGTWFRVSLESPFAPGKTTRGRITYPGYEHLVMEVVVQRMEPERLFSYTWHPNAVDSKADYSGEKPTLVEFRLEPSALGTLLTVTESGFSAIPAHRRDEAFRMNSGGWTEQVRNIQNHATTTP
ncbi:hypothetical protein PHYC_00670 [Phycisphaerales bacterium]|nr:hypothetical protein PHYC_00670 [Phycisphaerales bacterium]